MKDANNAEFHLKFSASPQLEQKKRGLGLGVERKQRFFKQRKWSVLPYWVRSFLISGLSIHRFDCDRERERGGEDKKRSVFLVKKESCFIKIKTKRLFLLFLWNARTHMEAKSRFELETSLSISKSLPSTLFIYLHVLP